MKDERCSRISALIAMAVMQAEDVVGEDSRSAGLTEFINSPVAVCAGAAEGRLPWVWEKEAAPEV
jgi:hypothetical protein